MVAPATIGQLQTRVEDMNVGDYIIAEMQISGTGTTYDNFIRNVGTSVAPELPLEGVATPNGQSFYFVKVTRGLLVADRVCRHSWSWDSINQNRLIEGRTYTMQDIVGVVRSLSGGVAYADENGNKSLTDLGFGAFPTTNEWDKYIVNFPQSLIQSGKTLNDVFHHDRTESGVPNTWCQDTPILNLTRSNGTGIARSTTRTARSASDWSSSQYNFTESNMSESGFGFRPVFEYKQ